MLQNPCNPLGFKKNMVYKIPPGGGEVNHIQPVAYKIEVNLTSSFFVLCINIISIYIIMHSGWSLE